MHPIRQRVLSALALARTPGLHFAGHFTGVSLDEIAATHARMGLVPGPFCEERDGEVNLGAVALLADMALAGAVRANLASTQRLGTVSMHLQLTGERVAGPLEATGFFEGFLGGAHGRQGLSRIAMMAGDRKVMVGSGTFMVLDPPPGITMHPVRSAGHGSVPPLEESQLTAPERAILARADEALAGASPRHSFIRRLWGQDPHPTKTGAACTTPNGGHIANRVGHIQGGLLVGLAATTAMGALPDTWMLSGVSAWFTRPGEGKALRTVSRVVHHGRLTAVVRTVITGKNRRRVLEAVTTHARRGR